MKKTFLLSTLLACAMSTLPASNTITSITQVTSAVTLSDDVDYVITSTTPFGSGGSVDIANTEHAVVVIQNVKPSQVIASYLRYIKINGHAAENGTNCEVRMYAQGAIIFPYAKGYKPLTVYSEQNFGGTSCNDFGLEHSGGFMNTLTEGKLNNRIRSFRLKRGYMVTFSTRQGGRGYSRCFIADQEDLEFPVLPTVLDKSISSYRVFQWFNAPKQGLASDTRAEANAALNSTWCYSWGVGESRLPDAECVPNHIYEDWPSASSCGSVTYSCHMKTNNEPGNSADDHPQDVATVLANWENLMRTGMRLCSESSHDGSMGHLKAFIDSIDARGWRCDILDLHCYWPTNTFNNLTWYSDYYGNGRPIWISEWVWGASWNNNGAFNVGNRNDYQGNWANCYNGTKPILEVLNANSRVERYAYWNSEANCSKIYLDGQLSTLGEYYSKMKTGLGYNKANEFIPRNPRQYDPTNLVGSYDKAESKITLRWHESNGEYNEAMYIQERVQGATKWSDVQEVALKEDAADYEVVLDGVPGTRYRIRVVDINGKDRLTNEITVTSEDLRYGEAVSVINDGTTTMLYLGGNRLINGDFLLGTTDWSNGAGGVLTYPYFQVLPKGGKDGSPYLQTYGNNTDAKHAQSIRKVMALEPNTPYYISGSGCNNNPNYQRISTSRSQIVETYVRVKFAEVDQWSTQGLAFYTAADTCLLIQLRNLDGRAQFDDMMVCRLFTNPEEAMADALQWEKQRAEAFCTYYADYEAIIQSLQSAIDNITDANELEQLLQTTYQLILATDSQRSWEARRSEDEMQLPFTPTAEHYTLVKDALLSPSFNKVDGWSVKTGTYTAGDQRLATQAGLTCWNAWWSLKVSDQSRPTMAIQQTTQALKHGMYALECKATTQHYCETDQHAWLYNPVTGDTLLTESLPFGNLDLPSFSNEERWHTLSTSYIYVEEKGKLEVGFVGSKGKDDQGKFIPYGNPTATPDNREGWWCATDFWLRRIPMVKHTADAAGWGTICLPAVFDIPEGVTLYEVAGILADGSAIALNPVSTTLAGYPYLYKVQTPGEESLFFENGEATTSVGKTNINGLRGNLVSSAATSYPLNSFRLIDGEFYKVEQRSIHVPDFTAFIGKESNLTILQSFDGVTLPIHGAETGIEQLHPDTEEALTLCDLQGRKSTSYSGLVVRGGRVVFCR